MTISQFENGYWYATDLKKFAKKIGIPNSSKLRKDELEKYIKFFLKTATLPKRQTKTTKPKGRKDSSVALTTDLRIKRFTNDKTTWDFLDTMAKEIDPNFKLKSGTKYRLNRWRDDQLAKANPITYGDLINAHLEINNSNKPNKRVEGTYYIYFLKDYLSNEENATREEAIKVWHELKIMDIPKTYKDWKNNTKQST